MKKIILILTVLLSAAWINCTVAQSPTDKLFDKYNGQDGFTTVHITQELFSLFADLDSSDPEAAEMKEMMSQLKYIRILMYEIGEDGNQADLDAFRSQLKSLNTQGFSELMVVKEKDEEVKFLALKSGDRISELLLFINEPGEAGFISIVGNIDINTVSKLSKTMNIQGMDNLNKLEDEK